MADLEVYDLICEYQTNPLGLGELRPRLGWKLKASRRGARQVAYSIRTALDVEALERTDGLLWESGRVASSESNQIEYEGPPLRSGERVWWQVQVWDEAGHVAGSDPAWWEMGLLDRADWEPARWIAGSLCGGVWTTVPLPFMRREFTLQGKIAKARLYVTTLGLYECWINGARVGQDWFTPGWTDYNKRVQYQVYDVTSLLRADANVWGAVLGDGWYCGHVSHFGRQVYGDRPKFFAKLNVLLEDGSFQTFVTDEHWQVHYDALLGSDNYNGEVYDARWEQAGWNLPGYDARGWQNVNVLESPELELSANFGDPVRAIQEITPISGPARVQNSEQAAWIFDFGQNMAGRVRLRVTGERGDTIQLRFAEMLNPDGSLYTENLRSALQTDLYTLAGDRQEVWEPRFTYHGFRYVEVSGFRDEPTSEMLTAVVMHSDLRQTGTFQCSDQRVNQLQHNIVWGQKSNFFDVPTDCPFRDERLGWAGDTQLFMRTAAFNMEIAPFFYKWLRDLVDAQSPRGAYPALAPRPNGFLAEDGGPAWGEAGVIGPWTLYLCYGDKRILERSYESMQRFFQFQQSTSTEQIRPLGDSQTTQGFGDWMGLDAPIVSDGSKYSAWQGGTSKLLIGTAFFAYSAKLLAKIARVLNLPQDVTRYTRAYDAIRQAFIDNFVSAEGAVQGETQTGYVLAIYFDLIPDPIRQRAAERLVRLIEARGMHLSTGFVGTPYLAHTLSRQGYSDVAYSLLLQQTYPSWLYPILQGATTIWERWDGWTPEHGFQDPAMNSFNHFALGAIGEWLYRNVAGIDVDAENPGYKNIVLWPQPGQALSFARATYESLYGTIVSDWSREGNSFRWSVTIPPNATATLYIPSNSAQVLEGAGVLEKSEGVGSVEKLGDAVVCQVASGDYHFQSLLAE